MTATGRMVSPPKREFRVCKNIGRLMDWKEDGGRGGEVRVENWCFMVLEENQCVIVRTLVVPHLLWVQGWGGSPHNREQKEWWQRGRERESGRYWMGRGRERKESDGFYRSKILKERSWWRERKVVSVWWWGKGSEDESELVDQIKTLKPQVHSKQSKPFTHVATFKKCF